MDSEIKKLDGLDHHELCKILDSLMISHSTSWTTESLRELAAQFMRETGISYKEMVLVN